MLNLACNMDAIVSIAKCYRLVVIEDACQAIGVSYKGRRLGSIGDLGAYSFNYYKNISSGEGGAIVTNSDLYSSRARVYHDIGTYSGEYEVRGEEFDFVGVNLRVSELTGAVLCAQLPKLDRLVDRLKSRRRSLVKAFSRFEQFRISPHNDPENAAGMTIIFGTSAEAVSFARSPGVQRIIDIRRHAYTDWIAVLSQCDFQDRANPYKWAKRQILYSRDMCERTIDVLDRTCVIDLGGDFPHFFIRARRLLRAVSNSGRLGPS
jgi:dTDP-4-amino-4,6-dideoxygalactose transaminase